MKRIPTLRMTRLSGKRTDAEFEAALYELLVRFYPLLLARAKAFRLTKNMHRRLASIRGK
jgi:hypothetical protein